MRDEIGQIVRKTYSYWWVDGMVEIGMGLFFGMLSGYNYLLTTLPLNPTAGAIMAIMEPLFFVACWFGYGRLVRWVKKTITYRRTGYVAYQPRNRRVRTKRAIISGILGFGMALLVTYIGPEILKISVQFIVGGVLALVTFFLAFRHGINRLLVVAAAEFALGLWTSTLPMDSELCSILLMTSIGAVWLISGIGAFIVYLFHTKPSQEENV